MSSQSVSYTHLDVYKRQDLDRADRDPSTVTEARVEHLKEKVETVKVQMPVSYTHLDVYKRQA